MRRLLLALALVPALCLASDVTLTNARRSTFTVCTAAEANTAAAAALVIEAGASKVVRVRSIWVNPGLQTTPGYRAFTLRRYTTASSAGTALTPRPMDSADPAFSGTVRSLPTPGSAGVDLFAFQVWVPSAVGNTMTVIWPPPQVGPGLIKDILIPAGTANGFGIADAGATGAASLTLCAAFTEE